MGVTQIDLAIAKEQGGQVAMGMSGRRQEGRGQSDINVTPLIDVVLVLLIIFLVVMPIMMRMETLEVPRKIDTESLSGPATTKQIIVLVKRDPPSRSIPANARSRSR